MLLASPCPGVSWRLAWPCWGLFLEFAPGGDSSAQCWVPWANPMLSLSQVGGVVASTVAGNRA